MQMKIEKKTWPEYFDKIAAGEKTFDLRLADWECNAGDIVVFKEWNPQTKQFTGRRIEKEVTYVLKTKDFENLKMWTREEIEQNGFLILSLK